MNWYKKAQSKANYAGNCVTGFSSSTGACTIGIFQDATEFSQREEAARDENLDLIDGLRIDRQSFLKLVNMPQKLLKKEMEFYRLPTETESMTYPNEILVAYDLNAGEHHFFA